MGRILQAVFILVVLGALGVLGYAYFGDMEADPVQTRTPVTLPGLAPPPPAQPVPGAALVPVAPSAAPESSTPAEAASGQ
ncbi:hypothetical protein C8J27_101117 [Rhodobacter aestuarii]|uniref:Uncharacterized protein n=1 Tax=Rhodobacter aestuarii TaxID=453582 RepID=A0A1N7JA72_9RHOB|nr:hypothetical protein [Rhodobacter aestuarii]PTV97009.1 hypothetical protein C8J27_101117 [Rhodobacter aestuarii]SIS46228.1 hypothetical protein SAMN05421580_101525 [Rhodobacter aestuarii]